MAWFKREKTIATSEEGERHMRTEGLWLKCDECKQIIWKKDIEGNQNVCPKCGAHWRIDAVERLKYLFDGDYELFDTDLTSSDPLNFVDSKPYQERLASMREATSLSDALISARGAIESRPVHICAMEIKFIGGSMGCVVGEKITRAIERSTAERVPIVIISASGGARMQ
jgi:acetyl-CoA carboxylase carboxyl transferase subunit beta